MTKPELAGVHRKVDPPPGHQVRREVDQPPGHRAPCLRERQAGFRPRRLPESLDAPGGETDLEAREF
eukprot:15465722-Alexandrium_andersonii.AAC.1